MNKAVAAHVDEGPIEGPIEGPGPSVKMVSIGELFLAAEAPKGYNLQVRDSGRGSPLTDAELKASIYNKGIIQPLIWKTVDGKQYVVAGNRRLKMLREIFADALESKVQTQDVDDFDGDWREIAMDTNLSLPPHLVERYEMIVTLVKDLKLSPEDARLRYGMTPRQFAQVMALGKMSPTVRKAWKDGDIDAKTAQAFTIAHDHKEQDTVFNSLSKDGNLNDWQVRRRLIPAKQNDAGRLITFVGIEVCRKAKLLEQEDLFATNHFTTDMKALTKLANDKITLVCADLVAAGWNWAMPFPEGSESYKYGHSQPTGKSDADQGGFSAKQREHSGCFLKISNDGELQIDYGRTKPEERKKVEASERLHSPAAKKKAKAKAEAIAADGGMISNALAQRLSEQLEKGLSKVLVNSHHAAVAALIAGLASAGHVVDIKTSGNGFPKDAEADFLSVFKGALSATAAQQLAMLAQAAGDALSIVTHNAEHSPVEQKGLAALVAALKPDDVTLAVVAEFDAQDYFASISMPMIVAAVRCTMGDEAADQVAKMKKPAAAKFAATMQSKMTYLPKQLRTVHYKGPVESAAKPPKAAKTPKTAKKTVAKKKAKKSKK